MTNWDIDRPKSMAERVHKRKDRPMARVREADVVPLLLPLIDLRRDQCRYPYGDSDFRFCGLTTMASSLSYCPEHHALCYSASVPRSLAVPSSLAA